MPLFTKKITKAFVQLPDEFATLLRCIFVFNRVYVPEKTKAFR